jgi:(4S)-4-hydroxy-5-phosphonooxypentane-2,3-dione isomerase
LSQGAYGPTDSLPPKTGLKGPADQQKQAGREEAMITIIRIAAFGAAVALIATLSSAPAAAQAASSYVNAVDLDIVPEQLQSYLAAVKENGAATVKEPGCREFDILTLASNPNHVFLFEVYESEAAYQAHRASDHFKKYAETTKAMVAKREARPMTAIVFNSKGK